MPLVALIPTILISIYLIWKGSDWVNDSLVPVASKLGTSYVAITTLLVSFMLSIPELFSTFYSQMLGVPQIGIGVIIGSVIINIGLTVGISAAIRPLILEKSVLVRDGVFLIIVAIIIFVFGSDLTYTREEGVVLLLLFIPYAVNVWFFESEKSHEEKKEKAHDLKMKLTLLGDKFPLSVKPSVFSFLIGALFIATGSYIFSFSLVELSTLLPLSHILIGVIFGAIGTGTPNIITAVQGTIKGYDYAAITETFGSNIFMLLVTFGIFIIINPIEITRKVFFFDLLWMIVIHALLIAFIIKGFKYREESLTRFEGLCLIMFYIGLIVANVLFFN